MLPTEDPAAALPPELLLQVLHFLDVNDLLSASRVGACAKYAPY